MNEITWNKGAETVNIIKNREENEEHKKKEGKIPSAGVARAIAGTVA